jgi:hypothetical protein
MATLNDIPYTSEPGGDPNPDPIRDGVYLGSSDHNITDINVGSVGDEGNDQDSPLPAGWVLHPGID